MLLEDCRANSWSLRPCCMVLAYRIAHFCSVWRKKNVLNNLWAAPVLVLYRVTIGNRGGDSLACPVIGNGVELGANAILIGDITIGHHVTVGAGSVVMESVPDNALVTGEKARVKVIK